MIVQIGNGNRGLLNQGYIESLMKQKVKPKGISLMQLA